MKQTKNILAMMLMMAFCAFSLISCSGDDDEPKDSNIYEYGISQAQISTNDYEEMQTIENTYESAFKKAGLSFSNKFFAIGTSGNAILTACAAAEAVLNTKNYKNYFVFYVGSSKGKIIYQKSYGTPKTEPKAPQL